MPPKPHPHSTKNLPIPEGHETVPTLSGMYVLRCSSKLLHRKPPLPARVGLLALNHPRPPHTIKTSTAFRLVKSKQYGCFRGDMYGDKTNQTPHRQEHTLRVLPVLSLLLLLRRTPSVRKHPSVLRPLSGGSAGRRLMTTRPVP